MSTIQTSSYRRTRDHFEPQDIDPHEQRRLRGLMEHIDYTAYVANREVVGQMLASVDAGHFQRLAVTVATARAKWVAEAVRQSESGAPSTPDQIARLTAARTAFEELSEAYEGLRRMVDRGYVPMKSPG
ncbi:MAG: hypothetical protein V7672_02280 [Brevundimonas sp.]|jgi:hypothetical protein|uniref:hypothetical protein n=1 Tax=Brevundimonas sp. TaxID=1871086 RepID=UPI002AB8CC25|nr:hypothetical protein [Brevundimonas sp.]MDZ4111892.1 hypothetical protein [Brevundimonas sp.]